MRGKEAFDFMSLFRVRITPAHAGKSGSLHFSLTRFKDHPRTCGEKYLNVMNEMREKGSPPHMRGKDKIAFVHGCQQGITPAHAGKSEMVRFRILLL